jgi:hypothetical protein
MAKAFHLLFLGKAVGNRPLEVPYQKRKARQIECNLYRLMHLDCN